jgi:hypothetical protein
MLLFSPGVLSEVSITLSFVAAPFLRWTTITVVMMVSFSFACQILQ